MTKIERVANALKGRGERGATIPELIVLCDMHYRHIRNCLETLQERKVARRTGAGWSDPHRYFWIGG